MLEFATWKERKLRSMPRDFSLFLLVQACYIMPQKMRPYLPACVDSAISHDEMCILAHSRAHKNLNDTTAVHVRACARELSARRVRYGTLALLERPRERVQSNTRRDLECVLRCTSVRSQLLARVLVQSDNSSFIVTRSTPDSCDILSCLAVTHTDSAVCK